LYFPFAFFEIPSIARWRVSAGQVRIAFRLPVLTGRVVTAANDPPPSIFRAPPRPGAF
jgi:hypothetical protein